MPQNFSFNDTLRAEMARRRITQTALAEALGLPQTQVSSRLRGATEWKVTELLAVAEYLGVTPASLLGDAA